MRLVVSTVLFFYAWMPIGVHAQNAHWQSVTTTPRQYYINTMYEDTIDNLLYVGGGPTWATGMLVYDGNSVQALDTFQPGSCWALIRFHDTIYAGGTSISKPLTKWNGVTWDTTGLSANGPVGAFCIYNSELYVGGMFTSIGGISSSGLAKFDGSTWTDVSGFPFSFCISVGAITEYNGELYVAGSFGDSLGNTMNIARWDGQQWRDVGGGFHGSMDEVWRLEIFNGELYIGGAFRMGSGNAGNYMAKWDGNTLSDVGGGTMGAFNSNGQVTDLAVWDSALYAVGVFEYAGGIFTSSIAKWDGANWCYMGDAFNGPISAVASFDTSLFIGGGWWWIGSDTISGFAKWIGGNYTANCGNMTSVSETDFQSEVFAFPNPATTTVTFQFNRTEQLNELTIYDALGSETWREESRNLHVEISVAEFAEGMYFYSIVEDGEMKANGKFIVQH